MRYTVLICEDNPMVQTSLGSCFQREGVQVIQARDGHSALDLLYSCPVDALVLGWTLPDIPGLDLLKQIRKTDSETPILMISDRGDELDRVLGLELGADDSVSHPYLPREVVIRVNRMINRRQRMSSAAECTLSLAELTVQPEGHCAWVCGCKVKLSPKELDALLLLLGHVGAIVARDQFLRTVWDSDPSAKARTVDTLIGRLRQKLCIDGVHFKISSVYGAGYRIEELEKCRAG